MDRIGLSNRVIEQLGVFLLVLLFMTLNRHHINADLWGDELYSLRLFTFVPFKDILLDYHVPNNHIFFNLVNAIYLKGIGESFFTLMDRPWVIRIVPLIYSALTLTILYKLCATVYNRGTAFWSCLVMLTTITYYGFALQIRGYGLSALLMVLLVYQCVLYLKRKRRYRLAVMALISALCFYTIPSNILAITSLLGALGVSAIDAMYSLRDRNGHSDSEILSLKPYLFVILSIIVGLVLALLFYAPIFNDVFFNGYTERVGMFTKEYSTFYLNYIAPAFYSGRWFLFAIALSGFLLTIKKWSREGFLLLVSLAICFGPIFLTLLIGAKTPLRVFTVGLPFFSVILGYGLAQCISAVRSRKYVTEILSVVILLVSGYTLYDQINAAEEQVVKNFTAGGRSQDLFTQFYTYHYTPGKEIRMLDSLYALRPAPVVIKGCSSYGVNCYLDKYEIPFYPDGNFGRLRDAHDSIYVITNHPSYLTEYPTHAGQILSDPVSFHTIVLFHKYK